MTLVTKFEIQDFNLYARGSPAVAKSSELNWVEVRNDEMLGTGQEKKMSRKVKDGILCCETRMN